MGVQKTIVPAVGAITASKIRYGILVIVCLLYFYRISTGSQYR